MIRRGQHDIVNVLVDGTRRHLQVNPIGAIYLDDSALNPFDARAGSGHGEWHRYEVASDTFRDQLAQSLYDAGFIRVGLDSRISTVSFEGTHEQLLSRADKIRRVAKRMGDERGVELQTDLCGRQSSFRRKTVEYERDNVSRDSVQAVQNFIRKSGRHKGFVTENRYAALVPQFVTDAGRLTDAGKEVIARWRAAKELRFPPSVS